MHIAQTVGHAVYPAERDVPPLRSVTPALAPGLLSVSHSSAKLQTLNLAECTRSLLCNTAVAAAAGHGPYGKRMAKDDTCHDDKSSTPREEGTAGSKAKPRTTPYSTSEQDVQVRLRRGESQSVSLLTGCKPGHHTRRLKHDDLQTGQSKTNTGRKLHALAPERSGCMKA